jgi:hypothetical protein
MPEAFERAKTRFQQKASSNAITGSRESVTALKLATICERRKILSAFCIRRSQTAATTL